MGVRLLVAILVLGTASLRAEINETGSLNEVAFEELSQRDPNPLGERALAIHPDLWKHAESEHFIYHFVHNYVATPVSVEAEFHYRVAAKELERDQPATDTKSHIYIFEQPEDWRQFQAYGQLEKWTGGICSAGSLFIQRNQHFKFSDNSLGHEIVHLVLHRYYPDGIPCWLNEGMAQYLSKNAHASYERARGYIARAHSRALADEQFIALKTLTIFTMPPNDRVITFYDESERLVRFLAETDKHSFLALLDKLGRHQPLANVLGQDYAGIFPTLPVLEQKFREYATQDFESAARND